MSPVANSKHARETVDTLPLLPFPPTVLAVAGCSGSGKTTLADQLARTLGGLRFHLDDYYLDLGHMPLEERVQKNFDDPAMIEVPLLASHIAALARGETIERPCYDFGTYTRMTGRTQKVAAGPFLIVEGLFALHYPELAPFYNLRVYIDTPDELCFERRLKRDMEERGRTAEMVRYQYNLTVRPASEAYVRPSAANADLVIDGTGALDWKVERVMTEMRMRGLLTGAS
ncbi:Uridine kinase [Candidatus Sulfotelmatomonas gaucii]|uniref:uridine/cytidine kinase n=1 Tax=Candidatus Sulfuritelmatomonas gaucii TaxID=2043161 RepID=A0A2N9LQC2_9BACT|nr:Uridine kinase [Candidatus Sulfotelmatomonas gaucii]